MHAWQILAVVCLAGVLLPSCSSNNSHPTGLSGEPSADDPSIIVDAHRAPSPEVENGTAHDRSVVDLWSANKVVLPDTATIRRAGEAGKVELFMAKSLSFCGHPPEPMSIHGARKNMGCAVRSEGDALVVATFGEWDSRIEGGASMKLVAVVPHQVKVERRRGLSGPDSAGHERGGQNPTKPKNAPDGYWYGPASPAEGWTMVPTVPDPERTASK